MERDHPETWRLWLPEPSNRLHIRAQLITHPDQQPVRTLHNIPGRNFPRAAKLRRYVGLRDRLAHAPYQRFLDRLFWDDHIQKHFFRKPAGQYHHAYAGGLAHHSVEVAESVENSLRGLKSAECIPSDTQDAMVITALLHDLGKLATYRPKHRKMTLDVANAYLSALRGDSERLHDLLAQAIKAYQTKKAPRDITIMGMISIADQHSTVCQREARESLPRREYRQYVHAA